MELWRVSNYDELAGLGGLYGAGRWHSRGRPIIYCGENPAGALLEVLVHAEVDPEDLPGHYRLFKIQCPGHLPVPSPLPDTLPAGWREEVAITRAAGDAWLQARSSCLLRVPSAIVPASWNVLINPAHADSRHLRIVERYQAAFDPRLFRF